MRGDAPSARRDRVEISADAPDARRVPTNAALLTGVIVTPLVVAIGLLIPEPASAPASVPGLRGSLDPATPLVPASRPAAIRG